jgi:hypothetical protein
MMVENMKDMQGQPLQIVKQILQYLAFRSIYNTIMWTIRFIALKVVIRK